MYYYNFVNGLKNKELIENNQDIINQIKEYLKRDIKNGEPIEVSDYADDYYDLIQRDDIDNYPYLIGVARNELWGFPDYEGNHQNILAKETEKGKEVLSDEDYNFLKKEFFNRLDTKEAKNMFLKQNVNYKTITTNCLKALERKKGYKRVFQSTMVIDTSKTLNR